MEEHYCHRANHQPLNPSFCLMLDLPQPGSILPTSPLPHASPLSETTRTDVLIQHSKTIRSKTGCLQTVLASHQSGMYIPTHQCVYTDWGKLVFLNVHQDTHRQFTSQIVLKSSHQEMSRFLKGNILRCWRELELFSLKKGRLCEAFQYLKGA